MDYRSNIPHSPNMSLHSDQQNAPHPTERRSGTGRTSRSNSQRNSTGSSIYGYLVGDLGIEAEQILGTLQKQLALLTGGRDRQGGPIITLPSNRDRVEFSNQELILSLRYLLQIPSEESKKRGISVLVEGRDGSWSNLSLLYNCLMQSLNGYLKQVLIMQREDQRRQSIHLEKLPPDLQPQFLTVMELHSFIDPNQLTSDLGGFLQYNHRIWLQNRLGLEGFVKDAQNTVQHLENEEIQIQQTYEQGGDPQSSPIEVLRQHRQFQESIMTVPTEVIRQGKELLNQLQQSVGGSVGMGSHGGDEEPVPTLDLLEAQKQVKRIVQYLEQRVEMLRNTLEQRDKVYNLHFQFTDWKRNVKTVVDWVLGPGEKLLSSHTDIGDSYEAAEELRRRHEEMEIKCTDTYGQYAELRHAAEEMLEASTSLSTDIIAERDYMDTVCRNMASRLERRRILLITSVRFHRLAEDFGNRLDDLLELVCSDVVANNVEEVEEALQILQEKTDACDLVAEQTANDGHILLDEMARPVKNAFGKDITPDYAAQTKYISQRLEELQERKMRCDELTDVRRLKLQQLLQLRTCERDCDQAIDWIEELCDVMVHAHRNMGNSPQEAEALQEDNRKFEATAMGTYEYGKQLLQASTVLRRSLRYPMEPNHEKSRRLEEAWKRFSQGVSERANRLTVSAMFLSNSDKVLDGIDNLVGVIAKALAGELPIEQTARNYALPRDKLHKDFKDTVQMGQALLERLALPVLTYEGKEKRMSVDEEGAAETVTNRLRKLDRKMIDAEKYWEEMQKALSDPQYQPRRPKPTPRKQRSENAQASPRSPEKLLEAEERRRRNDPLGFSRRRIGSLRSLKDEQNELPKRRGQGSISERPDQLDGSLEGSQDSSSMSPRENSIPKEESVVLAHAQPYEAQHIGVGSAPSKQELLDKNLSASPFQPSEDLHHQLQESAEWIRVRVHQMEPDLMDVGSNLEEALQLQHEHQELLFRLKSKEGEVLELLRRADVYADENRSQTDVHGAMADTLAEAWRDLNDKLQYRSKLLEQSVTFHQSAQDLSSKMEQAQGNFIGVPLASDVDSARRLLQQHNDMKQTILESSKFTLDLGQSLLDQIKEMGMHADIQNRHATTAACYGIEHLLELLHDKRRHLEELWTQRKIQLEQCLHLCQLDQEVNKILEWFRTIGASYLTRTDLGTSYTDSKRIQEEHSQFEAEAREIQENMLRLLRTADGLLRRTNIDAEGIRQRLMLVDQECENFMIKLDNRRKNIFMAVSFFNLAETALNKLDQVEVQLNNMDLPRNSAELAERHSQLSNAIVDVSTEAIHEGRLLLERVSSVDPGADGVRRKLDELHSRCTHLESLCKARRAEAWQRSQAYLHFQENYNSLSTWLSQIGHSMLARHSSMGTSLASAKDFLEVHEQLDEDIRDKNADLEALSSAAMALVKSGDQEAKNAAERADALHKQFARLQRIVETRIQLALIYVSFLKLVQQLSTSLDSLQHIIRSETEDLQDLTDTALQQVQTMYTQMEQLFAEFNSKGKLFLQNSSTITDDSRLEVRTAISLVESSLTEYGQRMTSLAQYWEAWQQHVISSKQFKSQWHQFIQDARRTIDHVMRIEREFFLPYIAGNLGNSLQKAQELQRKLTEFIPIAKKAQEDIEEHLKTAELLSLKGDTRGQKEQIVNELIRVHQRFQARMNEYQILIKMTIQFFKNVSQLDELIEKTEREYMQSQLPTDLSQAESMLEEHKRKKTEVSHFINYTAEEGDKIVRRVRQQDAEAAAREDVQQVLDVMTEYRRRWDSTWEEQERRLRQNLQICQFHYDLRQIHSEIDELHQHLQARRGSYGNSLPAAKMTAQAFNQFEKTVELIERKIKDFISTAELMVQDKHYDSENIHREIDVLKKKWSTFHTSVRDYRTQLNTSVLYFTLIEECEMWMREGSQLLINIGRRAPECRAPQDAADLIQSLERFVEQGKPLQEQRLQKISELSLQLYGDQGANKVRPLIIQYQDIMQSFEQADNELSLLRENLEGKQGPPIEETMDRQTAAAAAAPRAQPKPPRITQHLKNAEVVEGVKFTFECRVESETVPEVRWFKDNLPLNSPDYETHYDRGLATLTIEETFSEDTARYTCRFTNQAGMAESSAYLTVKAMRPPVFQQPLHDITAPEGKSVHFEVRFTGSPAPDVAWFRGPKRILPSATYKITIEANFSSLDIREAYAEDSDTYTVIIKNMGGEVRSSCKLTIESVFSSPVENLSQVSTDVEPQRPMFTQLLSPTKDVPEGARVRLDCVLVGHPEPEVIWLKNEKPVKESQDIQLLFEGDHCTLVIREAVAQDSGTYKVIARNPHGAAESTCKLHVEPVSEMSDASVGEMMAPKFTQPLKDLTIKSGQRVCLQCRVSGHPMPEVQWFMDNKQLESSPDFQITAFADVHSLTIPEVFEEDSGSYMVRAFNSAGEATCLSRLTVQPVPEEIMQQRIVPRRQQIPQRPPEFTRLFQDLNAKPGDSVTFECVITGSPKPKVSWLFNGEPLVSQDYQVSMEGDTYRLTIPEVFDEDAGRFSVTAENPSGKATCSAVLTVAPPLPSVPAPGPAVRPARTVSIDLPDTLALVPSTGIAAPQMGPTGVFEREMVHTVTTTEKRVSRTFTTSEDEYMSGRESHSETVVTEVRPKKKMKHSERYSASLTADLPPKFQPVDLTIEVPVPPKFVQALKSITVMEGTRVTFEGVVTGKPEPTIRWFREGKELTDQPDFEISYSNGRVSMTIPEVFDEDGGQYTCSAENNGGIASSTAELIVRASMTPPSFTEKLVPQYRREGEPVRLTVKVTGIPAPTVTWYREGRRLISSPDFEIKQEGDIHSLYIPEVFYEDTGRFSVCAENPAGEITSTASLTVEPPPSEAQPVERAPERKPVYESLIPQKVSAVKSLRPLPEKEEPVAKLPKLQQQVPPPAAVLPESEDRYRAELQMQVEGEMELPPFEKRIALFSAATPQGQPVAPKKRTPVPESPLLPRKRAPSHETSPRPFVKSKEKPTVKEPLQRETTARQGHPLVLKVVIEGHPEPIVKWYREEIEITNSRDYILTQTDKTYTLTIVEVFPEDSGTFRVIATNADGSVTSETNVFVEGVPEPMEVQPQERYREQMEVQFEPKPQELPAFEKRIHLPPAQPPPPPPFVKISEKPRFSQPLKNTLVKEGQSVKLTVRVEGHPEPVVHWYRDGCVIEHSPDYQISQMDKEFSLLIAEVFPEDSGIFKCVATNAEGSSSSEARLEVEPAPLPVKQIAPEVIPVTEYAPPLPKAPPPQLPKVTPSHEPTPPPANIPPAFVQQLPDVRLTEGANITLECRVLGKPFPQVVFTRNDQPVFEGPRHKITVNERMGLCTLLITKARTEDLGEYTCTAINPAGQDSTSGNVLPGVPPVREVSEPELSAVRKLIAEEESPRRPDADRFSDSDKEFKVSSFEQRLMREIEYREGKVRLHSETETEYDSEQPEEKVSPTQTQAPQVQQPLKDFRLIEGSDATFVCKVSGRPRPKIAWYKDGKRIKRSSRYEIKYTQDGYSTLRIRMALPEDAGHYTMLAVNSAGKTTCSSELYVDVVGNIDATSFVAPETLDRILRRDSVQRDRGPEDQGGIFETNTKPQFKKIPTDLEVREGNPVRLDCIVSGRPIPEFFWYRNQVPVHNDDNHKIVVNEDGIHSLLIMSATRQDTGVYTCIARNKAGEDTFTVTLTVLEREQMQPPRFIERMKNYTIVEGQSVSLTCHAEGIPTPMISWQKNNKMLTSNKDYRIETEGGHSTLRIMNATLQDSAWFQCSAVNVAGTASTRSKLVVQPDLARYMPAEEPLKKVAQSKRPEVPPPRVTSPPLFEKRQLSEPPVMPEKRKPEQLPVIAPKPVAPVKVPPAVAPKPRPPRDSEEFESAMREYIRREGQAPPLEDLYDKTKNRPPKFKTQIKDLLTLKENEPAHFECKLIPIGDPTMRVEWFKDGEPLHHGTRYKPEYDFGFVSLDIQWVNPEDSGVYTCHATNNYGEDSTSATIKCKALRSIIMDTQLPGEGAARLQEMEEHWRSQMILEERYLEEPQTRSPPLFDLKPEPVETGEGEPAKFLVKVGGFPRPRVSWWINGSLIVSGTRFKLTYDGMMHHLEIPRVREYDAGQIRVVAKNSEGEAECSTSLQVLPREDWRARLRQAPKGELEIELERRRKIELRSVELDKAFKRPRATEFELRQLERAAETKIRVQKDQEVITTERQYISVHSQLRHLEPSMQAEPVFVRQITVETIRPEEPSKVSEQQITLERGQPPVFTKPLRPVRVPEGSGVTLEVTYTGMPPPIISWYRDSFEIQPSRDFQITTTENSSTLHIPEVFLEDSGVFSVKAYNKFGQVQCKAKLTVVEAEEPQREISPEFRSLMRDSVVTEGEPATFDCQVAGNPPPKVHWQKDGRPLGESHRWKFIDEDENHTLVIYEVRPEDAGLYACVAINSVGKSTCTARLTIEIPIQPPEQLGPLQMESKTEAPFVVEEPRSVEVEEGEPVKFTCRITGRPAPVVTWYRNNQLVKPSKYFQMSSTTEGVHILSIMEAFPEDTGTYKCVARNKSGEVACITVLKVHGLESEPEPSQPMATAQPPSFIKPVANTMVPEGTPARFEAVFSGYPTPDISWIRNGIQTLHSSREYKIETKDSLTSLTIFKAMPEDTGLITCRAKNQAGTAECSAELYVQQVPESTETAAPLVARDEITVTLEGLEAPATETAAPEIFEVTAVETIAEKPIETEDVSPKLVTRETAEAISREETQEEAPLPESQEAATEFTTAERFQTLITEIEEAFVEYQEAPEVVEEEELEKPSVSGVSLIESSPEEEEEGFEVVGLPQVEEFQEEVVLNVLEGHAPTFLQPLHNVEAMEGQPVCFETTVTGFPQPEVTWFLDGEPIKESPVYHIVTDATGLCILELHESFPEDEGEYECRASNKFGTVSTKAELYIQERAEEKDETHGVEEILSEKEKLVTAEEEKDEVSDEERKEEAPEELKPHVAEVEKLRFAPEIRMGLEDISTLDGGQAQFTAKIVGAPQPEVTWYKEEEVIFSSDVFEIIQDDENNFILFIHDVMPEDAGRYSIVAKNEVGTAISSAQLTVSAEEVIADVRPEDISGLAPEFIEKPRFQSVEEGTTVIFKGTVEAIPQPEIHWTKDSGELPDDERYQVMVTQGITSTVHHISLTVTDVNPQDAGTYHVTASNQLGEESVAVSLIVNPELTEVKKDFRDQLQRAELEIPEKPITVDTEQVDFRGQLKSEVKTRVGIIYETQQTDFRNLLRKTAQKAKKFETDVTTVETVVTTEELPEEQPEEAITEEVRIEIARPEETRPEFLVPIQDLTIKEGEVARFDCQVKCEPEATLVWYHLHKPIKSDDIYKIVPGEDGWSSLIIAEAFPEDSGIYTVRAVNSIGENDCSAVLTVEELVSEVSSVESHLDEEREQLIPETVAEEAAIKIQAAFRGFMAREHLKIMKETKLSLEHEVIMHKEKGPDVTDSFTLQTTVPTVEEVAAAITLEEAKVPIIEEFAEEIPLSAKVPEREEVAEAITIHTEEAPVTEEAGESVTLEVEFPADKEEEEVSEAVILETPTPVEEEVSQAVILESKPSAEEAVVAEETLLAPHFDQTLSNQEITEGENVTFEVKVTGTPKPEITWFQDDVRIQPDERHRMSEEDAMYTFTITNATLDDDAEYTCTAKNAAGSASTTAELFVNAAGEAPTFISTLTDTNADVGTDVVLECKVKGTPEPEIVWLRSNVELIGDRYQTEHIEETVRLTIFNCQPEDEDEYTVKAVNRSGVASCTASLAVQFEAPTFTHPLEDLAVRVNDTVHLVCRVKGIPQPEVIWLVDKKPLTLSPRFSTTYEGDEAALEIADVTLEDTEATYTCHAQNIAGEASTVAHLLAQGRLLPANHWYHHCLGVSCMCLCLAQILFTVVMLTLSRHVVVFIPDNFHNSGLDTKKACECAV